jgi:hypothetical protein
MSVPFMADPAAEIQEALDGQLRTDAGVIAAFAPAPVLIFDTPPTGIPAKQGVLHYIIIAALQPLPVDGTDAANTEVTLDIWSLTDPPSKLKAQAIGAAALRAAMGLSALPSFDVKSTRASQVQYLTDRDGVSGHGIVKLEIVTQPKS